MRAKDRMSESVSAQLCSAVLRPRFGRAAMLRSSAPRAAHGCGSADSAPGDENQKTVQGTQEHRANRARRRSLWPLLKSSGAVTAVM